MIGENNDHSGGHDSGGSDGGDTDSPVDRTSLWCDI